jgi:hypothetical protein
MRTLRTLLLLACAVFAQSPTGAGTFLLKRTTSGGPVDLTYFDSVWNVGTGLRRSGDTIFLNYSGVTPGTYGDATHVFQGTVDSFGRITTATSVPITGGGGGGGVSSVGLALPSSVFAVSGSPVTTSGTLTGALQSQTANQVFASPNGSSGVPTFRAFLPGDISFLTDSISVARAYTLARIHDSMTTERARVPDSARASHIADTAKVAGLSDSAKALINYIRGGSGVTNAMAKWTSASTLGNAVANTDYLPVANPTYTGILTTPQGLFRGLTNPPGRRSTPEVSRLPARPTGPGSRPMTGRFPESMGARNQSWMWGAQSSYPQRLMPLAQAPT